VRAWVAYCAGEPELRVGTLVTPEEVADWDLARIAAGSHRGWGRLDPEPLLLVCGNGRRDPCCGHFGRRMAEQLWAGPDLDRIISCTHLGGHRFAPTALLLPAGVLHGRLTAGSAAQLLGAARSGWTPTASLRGHSTLDEAEQAAEARVRSWTGHAGIAPLRTEVVANSALACVVAVTLPPDGGAPGRVAHVGLAHRERQEVTSCGRRPESILRWEVVTDGQCRVRPSRPTT
ncbi:MAG: sucrase ferredoxin, partial [Candidatus Nanopelagicales bacterium]